jgi:hypothetical protein
VQTVTHITGLSICAPSAEAIIPPPPAPAGSHIRTDAPHSPITGELLPPPLPASLSSTNPEVLNCICTPYVADAFDALLEKFPVLKAKFPHLTLKLRNSFPMGLFPKLQESVIFPNNKSINQHMDFIEEYFKEEVELGRMSGPYTKEELETWSVSWAAHFNARLSLLTRKRLKVPSKRNYSFASISRSRCWPTPPLTCTRTGRISLQIMTLLNMSLNW